MSAEDPRPVTIEVDDATRVSALWQRPAQASALLLLAHGAGAGMRHPFMSAVAEGLAPLGIATLRYQFPYMEKGGRRPDPPGRCHATVRAAAAAAHRLDPTLPLLAGGKSFGGRMTSQAQAASPLPEVRGLVFLGFPLHPPGQPSDARADHLTEVHVPMLFLQGTRDEFAESSLLSPLIERLGERAALTLLGGADHSFHVAARTGRTDSGVTAKALRVVRTDSDVRAEALRAARTDSDVRAEALRAVAAWAEALIRSG